MKTRSYMGWLFTGGLLLFLVLGSLVFAEEGGLVVERGTGSVLKLSKNGSGAWQAETIVSREEGEREALIGARDLLIVPDTMGDYLPALKPAGDGAWDFVLLRYPDLAAESEAEAIEYINNTEPVEMVVQVPKSLLPLNDERMLQLITHREEVSESAELIEQILEDAPEDWVLWLLAMDDAILMKENERFINYFSRWIEGLEQKEGEFFDHAIAYYREMLRIIEINKAGNNITPRMFALNPEDGIHVSREEWLSLLSEVEQDDVMVPEEPEPFVLKGDDRIFNMLPWMVRTKTSRVYADFKLLQGNTSAALDELFAVYRLNVVGIGNSAWVMSTLVALNNAESLIPSIQLAYSNGFDDAESLEKEFPRLEAAYEEHRLAIEGPIHWEGFDPIGMIDPVQIEVRLKLGLAKMSLAHSAAAVRHHTLKTDEYPSNSGNFTALLDTPTADPFAENNEPLKFRRLGDNFILYSIGPDKKDYGGAIEYDLKNGLMSEGDIVVSISRSREYPGIGDGLPESKEEILRLFTHGLPPDIFNDNGNQPYSMTDDKPARLYSAGPDQDSDPLQPSYDPTNGVVSAGNIYMEWD